jgi:hypothetical protein
VPLVSTVDAAAWGFGVSGLSVRTRARIATDLASGTVWPGTGPAVQLLEAYAEYARPLFTVQLGRTHLISRLGFTGVDGGQATVRPLGGRVRVGAFGGWGLARGVPLSIASPELNPLDEEFQPARRQLVFGGTAGIALGSVEARVIYQREIEPELDIRYGERGAVDLSVRPSSGIALSAGAEYDFVGGQWGSHDLTAQYRAPSGRWDVTLAQRRYRPYFDVWTIWGAFSPIAHDAYSAALGVTPLRALDLRGRVEYYAYEDPGTQTPLVNEVDAGWRVNTDVTYTGFRDLTLMWNYHVEDGVGASAVGYGGRVMYRGVERVTATIHGGYLLRPLEFRFSDARLFAFGLRLDGEPAPGVRATVELVRYDETRDRPDAARLEWGQWRVNAGLTLSVGSADRGRGLHPAILRIPERRAP